VGFITPNLPDFGGGQVASALRLREEAPAANAATRLDQLRVDISDIC
jgi:hypothetical protein